MMHTLMINLKPDCPALGYLKRNTAGSRAVRNTALFYLRNTMTGLRKSPEERTKSEIEALHFVFTGIQAANRAKDQRFHDRMLRAKAAKCYGMKLYGFIMKAIRDSEHFPYPDEHHWCLSYEQLDAIMRYTNNASYYSCTSQVNQQAIRKTVNTWKSWLASLKDWKNNPGKYRARPRIPGYIRTKETTAHFTNQAAKLITTDGHLMIRFNIPRGWEKIAPLPIGPESLLQGKYIKLEVKPSHGRYRILFTYEDGKKEPEVPKHPERILGMDPGLNNLFAGFSNVPDAPAFLISGKWIKSQNQWFNKERARLLSARTKGKDSKQSEKRSKRLDALSRKREHLFRDYFYKVAHWICRYCMKYQIEAIVIGHNEGQKQNIRLKDKGNQNFVSIPMVQLDQCIQSVARTYAVPVVIREESYTSKASLLDGDEIPDYGEEGAKEACFSGKRIKRGLYRSKEDTIWNADLNGAENILRKEFPYAFDGKEIPMRKIEVVTREELCHVKAPKKKAAYQKKKSESAFLRHEWRKAKRQILTRQFTA